jgi:hypothetical protein
MARRAACYVGSPCAVLLQASAAYRHSFLAFEKLVVGVVTVTFGEHATAEGYRPESRLLWRGSKTDAADRGGRIFDLAGG